MTVTDLNLDEIASLKNLESLNLAAPSNEYVMAISTGVPRLRGAIRVTDFGGEAMAGLTKAEEAESVAVFAYFRGNSEFARSGRIGRAGAIPRGVIGTTQPGRCWQTCLRFRFWTFPSRLSATRAFRP